MFKYMKKAERFQNKTWFGANEEAHGMEGPLITAPHDAAEISNLVLESFQSKGLPFVPDMFTTGESSSGCGHAVRSIYRGVRTTSVDYLGTDLQNLHLETNLYVDKVLIDSTDAKDHCVRGVQTTDGKGSTIIFEARNEVIITAGTYGSPAILLRSGIGNAAELRQLGIEPIMDRPGVGKNLMDHLVMLSFYEVARPGLTNDHLIWHSGAKERTASEYKEPQTGFFSQFPFGVFAFARLDERLKNNELWQKAKRADGHDAMGATSSQPHIEFWNTECYSPKYMFKDFPPNGKHAFAMATTFFNAQSRGEVTLRSTDPSENPRVQHNYLSNPLNMLVFSEGCRLANEIAVDGAGTKDVIVGSWPTRHGHDKFTERKQWEEAIRQRADTCYHPAGTCKMGSSDDRMAVVDAQLRVQGINGLRVADASIMPLLNSGHPQMPVLAIGEKAADLIKSQQ